jgi:hypothetical protein
MKKLSVFSLIVGLLFVFSCEDKVEKDTTPPELTIVSPSSGSTVGEIVQIKVQTTDESGILKVDFYIQNSIVLSDTTLPYEYEWNTTTNQDGEYKVKVVSFDTKENFVESEVSVTVDNESKKPSPLDITSVEYDLEKMTVKWNQSQDIDFKQYNLHYSDSENGTKTQIRTFTNISTTSFDTTTFDPTKHNWYFLEVLDIFGLKSMGKGKPNSIENIPNTTEIDSIIYSYNEKSLTIYWSENTEYDFESYTLFETNSIGGDVNQVFSTTDRSTNFHKVSNINEGLYKYYNITTQDKWGLKSTSQIYSGNSYIKFIKTYGYEGNGGDVIQHDKGYTLTGWSDSKNIVVISTDFLGDVLWKKEFIFYKMGRGFSIINTSDGGYIIVGSGQKDSESSKETQIIKLSSEGDLEWSKSYGDNQTGGYSIVETSEGDFVYSTRWGLCKISKDGDLLWNKLLPTSENRPMTVSNGGSGFISSSPLMDSGYVGLTVYSISTSGDLVHSKNYISNFTHSPMSITHSTDNGYIITGYTNESTRSTFVTKYNGSLIQQWYYTFTDSDGLSMGMNVSPTINGNFLGFIVTGRSSKGIFLHKLNSSGVMEWESVIEEGNWGYSVIQSKDGGYVITGSTNSNPNEVTLIKTDDKGRLE